MAQQTMTWTHANEQQTAHRAAVQSAQAPTDSAAAAAAAERLETAPPQAILRWAVQRYRPRISLACSFGMQSVAMIGMLHELGLLQDVEVFYLDTGVLFNETHQTRLRIQNRYGFDAVRVAPELTWAQQQAKHGGHLYEQGPEGINQCCHIRKVEPMKRYLAQSGARAWITGMRRSHNATRQAVPVVMWDQANEMLKVNPVAAMDDAALWGYIQANEVPYNPLYDQGYASIGCDTPICTARPGADGGHSGRGGRWAGTAKTECGIHVDGKIVKSMDSSSL
jgi:phosphoadenosine phosphosulfate reductase